MYKNRTWTSYYDQAMGISMKLPVDWNVGKSEDFQLLLISPKVDGYSVNLAVNEHNFKGSQKDFENAILTSSEKMSQEYPGYKKISDIQCWIDGFPAYHKVYSWNSEDGVAYVQTMTLIYDMSSRLFEFTGSTLQSMPKSTIELLEEITTSTRVIMK